MPLVGLYVKHPHGSETKVAEVVLVAHIVMVPVVVAVGWLCERWGASRSSPSASWCCCCGFSFTP
jgi:hypothetical protein